MSLSALKNSQFDSAIKAKLDKSIGIDSLEVEAGMIRKHIRQLTVAKEKLGTQMDRLDYSDRHYDDKMTDMQRRLDSLYDDIAEANTSFPNSKTTAETVVLMSRVK